MDDAIIGNRVRCSVFNCGQIMELHDGALVCARCSIHAVPHPTPLSGLLKATTLIMDSGVDQRMPELVLAKSRCERGMQCVQYTLTDLDTGDHTCLFIIRKESAGPLYHIRNEYMKRMPNTTWNLEGQIDLFEDSTGVRIYFFVQRHGQTRRYGTHDIVYDDMEFPYQILTRPIAPRCNRADRTRIRSCA